MACQIGESGRGKSIFAWGLWKLNAKLLSDECFNKYVIWLLKNLNDQRISLFERWETLKEKLKMAVIERSSAIILGAWVRERELLDSLNCLFQLRYRRKICRLHHGAVKFDT